MANIKERKGKRNTNVAKIKNKYFDIEVDPVNSLSCSNIQEQQLSLVADKQNKEQEVNRLNELWKHKLEVNANKIKGRQQLKNTYKTHNFREDLHKKL